MKTKYTILSILILLGHISLFADGLIIPEQKNYPYNYLKNKVTEIYVEINGLIAETEVTQEFENEWYKSVDGVYSFPMPLNARATRLQYSVGDTIVDAILKVKQQSTNPGTGDGGIVAEINQYMGANAIRIALSNIPANGIKTVKLSYIQVLKQFNGIYQYNYPLNTGEFIKHPLDHLKINIEVKSSKNIETYDLLSHLDYKVVKDQPKHINISYVQPKTYSSRDIDFYYQVENSPFNIDFYSWQNDTTDAYMCLVGKPQIEAGDSSMPQNVIFMLSNSTTMMGNKLNQSKKAIALAIAELSVNDYFNILISNASVTSWQSQLVAATSQNINDALSFIEDIGTQSGNRLDSGLKNALLQLQDSENLSSIIAFTDGRSPVDPYEIGALNTQKTGIYFIAIGNDIDRVRLEAVAAENYGFISYINASTILAEEMMNVFQKVQHPILKELDINYSGALVHSVYPKKLPTLFAGSDVMLTARYQLSKTVEIDFEGIEHSGGIFHYYQQDLSHNEISRKMWAKKAIDDLEAQILIFGENDSLKSLLIKLSLAHNIRCRYTSFNQDSIPADIDGGDTGDGDPPLGLKNSAQPAVNASKILHNYPNPFVDFTVLKLQIEKSDENKSKYIALYDIHGRLIRVIDISDLGCGEQEVILYRKDFNFVSNGIVIVQLKVGENIRSTTKLIMAK